MLFYVLFFTVSALTVLSGAAATMIAILGRPAAGSAQKALVNTLAQIALVGATALAALLTTAPR